VAAPGRSNARSSRRLEVGAGLGGFTRAALERGWKVDATEISRSALERLGELPARTFGGSIEEARYPEGSFDLVVALEVLEHIPDPLPHLLELSRVTRPGGLLLLTTPNFNGLSRRLVGYRWRVVCAEHLGYFSVTTLQEALSRAGYRGADVRTRSLDTAVWAGCRLPSPTPSFDPQASAALRDRVEGNRGLRALREGLNALLAVTRLGDSLVAWARR
jgi:SAM-dependent methyltransferase